MRRSLDTVGIEPHDLFADPLIDLGETTPQRFNFVCTEYLGRRICGLKAARIARHQADKQRRDTMRSKQVVAREQAKHFNAVPRYWLAAGDVVADRSRATARFPRGFGDWKIAGQRQKLINLTKYATACKQQGLGARHNILHNINYQQTACKSKVVMSYLGKVQMS
ncbi:hypothetical protein [Paraburkholderia fungorum]